MNERTKRNVPENVLTQRTWPHTISIKMPILPKRHDARDENLLVGARSGPFPSSSSKKMTPS
eukprot:scaffold2430_cov159-Amphora_coffeaeformis.AAC.5